MKVRCECGWEGEEEELLPPHPEELPESRRCPCCDGAEEDVIELVPACEDCDKEYVEHEGDQCGPCQDAEMASLLVFNDAVGG